MKWSILRSLLILPANVPRFIEKAYLRGADGIMLDLEDSVPSAQKHEARRMIKDSIPVAGKGGAQIFVRVNNDESLLVQDLEASVYPGLHAIFLPKVEHPNQVVVLSELLSKLEHQRGIEPGSIRLSLHIESPLGIINLKEIASADPRTESISMGVDDYCLQLEIEPSENGSELMLPFSMMVIACRAFQIVPLGILGSVAEYRNLEKFRAAAERGRNLGSSGAFCIHPDQVPILNEIFSPSLQQVEYARRIISVFEEAQARGRASTALDGKMVDTPIYKRALMILKRAEAIVEMERMKSKTIGRFQ